MSIILRKQASSPDAILNNIIIFSKVVSGVSELFLLDDAGNESQITDGGKIKGALPAGGTTGQIPSKLSNADGDIGWITPGIGPHHFTHENGGPDEISVAGLSGLLADPQTPIAHHTTHEFGGPDEISVAGLSGLLADPQNITVEQSGSLIGTRTTVNFTGAVAIVDDVVNNRVNIAVGGAGTSVYFPYLEHPSSPDPWDLDAAIITDPDLANNGWTVQGFNSPWTTYTRVGTPDLSSFPAANTYRSAIVNGQLWVQIPFTDTMMISKAAAPGYAYKMRVRQTLLGKGFAGISNFTRCFVGKGGNHLGASGTVQVTHSLNSGDGVTTSAIEAYTNGGGGGANSIDLVPGHHVDNVRYLMVDSSSSVWARMVGSLDGVFVHYFGPALGLGAACDVAGVILSQPHASMNHVFIIDFMRRTPFVNEHTFP